MRRASVSAFLQISSSRSAGLGETECNAMRRHFRTTSRYEWMFWDMGRRQERWPV